MDLETFRKTIVIPAADLVNRHGGPTRTMEAERFMLAIALQESGAVSRVQAGGPARGFWQFELGGIHAVMNRLTRMACLVANEQKVNFDTNDIYHAIGCGANEDDILAGAFARMLILTDPKPLPVLGYAAYTQYIWLWRPGKPRPLDWIDNWTAADKIVGNDT